MAANFLPCHGKGVPLLSATLPFIRSGVLTLKSRISVSEKARWLIFGLGSWGSFANWLKFANLLNNCSFCSSCLRLASSTSPAICNCRSRPMLVKEALRPLEGNLRGGNTGSGTPPTFCPTPTGRVGSLEWPPCPAADSGG